jgi:signal peptidase I
MEKSPGSQPRGLKWLWREWVWPILLVVAIVMPLRSSIADWYDIPSGSMIPTILEGDRVVVNKLAYDLKLPFTSVEVAHWANPRRGDVIVFRSPADGIRLVKRVIGLPGDTLSLVQNRLWINSQPIDYEPLAEQSENLKAQGDSWRHDFEEESLPGKNHAVMFTPDAPARRSFGPVVVPAGHYFVMGDNRDNSNDSRFIGTVPRESIAGRATAVALSFDRKHWFMPRFKRFFRGL